MKKLLLAVAAMALSLSVWAQHRESQDILDKLVWNDEMLNIMLDTRADFRVGSGTNDDKQLGFVAGTSRIWVVGEIVPGVRYRLRHRLNKANTPLRDSYGSATDQAWVAIDFGRQKNWTATIGKQSVQLGTFEYDYSGGDIYLGTMVFNDFDNYSTGVNLAYRFLGQTINLQVVNSNDSQFASNDYRNRALAGLVLWAGDLWNGIVKTRWGYGLFQHDKDKFYSWITAGVQLNAGNFTSEFDYYNGYRNIDYSNTVSVLNAERRYVHDQSASVNLKLALGKWHPFVKGVWSNRYDRDFGRDAYRTYGAQAVVEYYPFDNERLKDLRFHAAYMYDRTDFMGLYSGMLKDKDRHSALIGIRWLFKAK